ncbi:MAG: DNA-formamidopyrimidine glycosylase [bacterium]|nr:DNA-formamidopyrimidine glycosylase [bacterium]
MPELPEVETIRRQLAAKLRGKKLQGKEIVDVRRRAKVLMIDFEDGSSLVFHLKLTGQLIFNGQPSKYTRKVFNFDDGTFLIFNDVRKFGWWKRVKDTKKIEEKFGPEPLTLDFKTFKELLTKRTNSKIKPLLMNQQFIAGLGNIYSDEILFEAGVRPTRIVKTLSSQEIKKIFQNIEKILETAIGHQGSSVEYYVDVYGQKGGYVKYHKVYRREGKKCFCCGTEIKRIKISGRSAHFCPKCQK